MTKNPRFQVLYKAHAPKTGVEYVNCSTLAQARREAAKLRKAGEKEVTIWDTIDNPISNLFSI